MSLTLFPLRFCVCSLWRCLWIWSYTSLICSFWPHRSPSCSFFCLYSLSFLHLLSCWPHLNPSCYSPPHSSSLSLQLVEADGSFPSAWLVRSSLQYVKCYEMTNVVNWRYMNKMEVGKSKLNCWRLFLHSVVQRIPNHIISSLMSTIDFLKRGSFYHSFCTVWLLLAHVHTWKFTVPAPHKDTATGLKNQTKVQISTGVTSTPCVTWFKQFSSSWFRE